MCVLNESKVRTNSSAHLRVCVRENWLLLFSFSECRTFTAMVHTDRFYSARKEELFDTYISLNIKVGLEVYWYCIRLVIQPDFDSESHDCLEFRAVWRGRSILRWIRRKKLRLLGIIFNHFNISITILTMWVQAVLYWKFFDNNRLPTMSIMAVVYPHPFWFIMVR